jgi:hypothetical protein
MCLPRPLPLILRGEIRVAMHQPPLIAEPPVDVRDSERHWLRHAAIHNDLSALETHGISEVAARKHHGILRNQLPTLEAVADPAKRLGELLVSLLDGPPRPKEVTSSDSAQQSIYGWGSPEPIAARAAVTRSSASVKFRSSPISEDCQLA